MEKKRIFCFVAVITGLCCIAAGSWLIFSRITLHNELFACENGWKLWHILLICLPLIAGIVLLIVKQEWSGSKITAIVGVITVAVFTFLNTTVIVEKRTSAGLWILFSVLIVLGTGLLVFGLFSAKIQRKRKKSKSN